MTDNSSPPRPTDSELTILQALWERGPSTVREVHDQLVRVRPAVYTSTLKLMQIMAEKGLVNRDESQRSHIYSAAIRRDRTQKQIVRHLVDRVFGGSHSRLVVQALSSRRTSPEELGEIRRLLDELEKKQK